MGFVKSRQWAYPILGVLLTVCASLGLVFVQAFDQKKLPTLEFIEQEVAALPMVYGYTFAMLLVLFTCLGFFVGRREDRLQAGSLTDPLTGLWNRRLLSKRLQEEVARSLRHRTPLAFLLVDVDHLKELNDHAGHQAGDEALRCVGDAIRRSCRRSDVAARYGGDEFAVLAPSTASLDALALAERIRGAVHEAPYSGESLSVSIGVADVSEFSGSPDELPKELCEAADRALYVAKQRGRDQVARSCEPGMSVCRSAPARTAMSRG